MSGGELPAGWVEATVGECASFVRGVTYEKSASSDAAFPGSVGVVRAGNITATGLRFDTDLVFVPGDLASPDQRLRAGDVVVAMSSGSASIVGKGAPVLKDLPNCSFGAFCGVFRPKRPELAPLLGHYFATPSYRNAVKAAAAGVNINNLRREHVLDLPIAIPPLNEQRRIVAKLDELRARSRKAREALDEVPALLDQLKQSVLAAAFRGDLTAAWREQNPNVEPASKLLERIRAERRKRWEEANPKKKYVEPAPVDAEGLPELPEGWCWASMEQVAWDITVGFVGPMQHRYVPTGVPFLRSQNVRENRFDEAGLLHIDEEFHADLKKSALKPGDVITVRSGAPGTTCVVPAELRDSNCADIVITRLTQSLVIPAFAAYFMNSRRARDQVLGAQVGVAQQHFNIGSMRKLHLPIPSHAEQAEIVRVVNFAFANVAQVSERAAEIAVDLNSLDQSILAKAFRGELVPQDPNDEPAEALLARVRAQAAERPPARKGRAPK